MINIIDNQYLGSVIYYKALFNDKHIELEQYERYQKSGFSNRCYIAGANGIISLSIPLVNGRNQKLIVKEVEIDNSQKWQLNHWRAIESSYMRSPWFEHYKYELEHFYKTEYKYLFEWNNAILIYISNKLDLNLQISLTSVYKENYVEELDNRHFINPRNYLDFQVIKYPQVFEERLGFLPNLSIIDLLFCCGKNGIDFL